MIGAGFGALVFATDSFSIDPLLAVYALSSRETIGAVKFQGSGSAGEAQVAEVISVCDQPWKIPPERRERIYKFVEVFRSRAQAIGTWNAEPPSVDSADPTPSEEAPNQKGNAR